MTAVERDWSALRTLREAVNDLDSSIYSGREVKRVYILLDAVASAAQEFFRGLFTEGEELTPAKCFERLTEVGLDINAESAASVLQELSAKKWYDNEKDEDDLEKAEKNREMLFQALASLVKMQTDGPPSQTKLFPADTKHEQG